jgi:hypothetical protein
LSRLLAIYIAGLVGAAIVGLFATSLLFPVDSHIAIEIDGNGAALGPIDYLAGVLFWTVATLVASSLPVRVSGTVSVAVSTAPIMASAVLGGPAAAAVVALIGTTESRELRGRVSWYGTLANHAIVVIPAIAGAVVLSWLRGLAPNSSRPSSGR